MVKYYKPKETLFVPIGYNFSMSPIYNHAGDDGTTGLLGEGRLPKYHPRMEALGVLDEASAALGLARALCKAAQTGPLLRDVQRDLYIIMSEVAATPENAQRFRTLESQRVEWLESQAETISSLASVPAEFILPGDSLPGAALAMARTIVRRAERRAAGLLDTGEIENKVLLQYLNRLSSLCFALEVLENSQAGKTTTLAKEK
jgi:cob(I)alamin adenosyltransferase